MLKLDTSHYICMGLQPRFNKHRLPFGKSLRFWSEKGKHSCDTVHISWKSTPEQASNRHSFIDNVPRSRRLEQRASYILHYHADTILGTLRRSNSLLLTSSRSAQCIGAMFDATLLSRALNHTNPNADAA